MRLYFFTKEDDNVFLTLNIITLLLFTMEVVLSSIGISSYFGNFFFWLDLISTISIITDIEPVWNFMIGTDALDDDGSYGGSDRGARMGSKAGRMARVVRLFRLIRLVKLYKQMVQGFENEAQKI
jgi:hypothetical protein